MQFIRPTLFLPIFWEKRWVPRRWHLRATDKNAKITRFFLHNSYPVLPQFLPNFHRILILAKFSPISYPILIPFLSHSYPILIPFSLHPYPILIPFFLNSYSISTEFSFFFNSSQILTHFSSNYYPFLFPF